MAMGVADTIMVGHYASVDLAAVALGHVYFFLVAIFGLGTLMALDPLVSQAYGARDHEAVARWLQRGLVLSVALAILAAAALIPAGPILRALGQPPDVVPVAAAYALVSIPGLPAFFFFVVFRQTLQALGRLRPIVWTIVGANLLNLFLNWVLIYGNLGMPDMGAVGSGWGSSLARWFMAALLLGLAWPLLRPYLRPLRKDVGRWVPLRRMAALGAPIGVQLQLEFGSFAAIAVLMGWLGTVAVAGHQVAMNLAALAFMVPIGIAAAAAVLVGRAVGEGDPAAARRSAAASLLVCAGFMGVTAAVLVGAPDLLARAYTSEPEVVALAASLLPIAAVFQLSDGLQGVAAGILRGSGDTRSPLVVHLVGLWLFGLPVGYILGFPMDRGASGLWWGLAVGLTAVALLLLWRVRSRLLGALRRVELEPAAGPEPGPTDPPEPPLRRPSA